MLFSSETGYSTSFASSQLANRSLDPRIIVVLVNRPLAIWGIDWSVQLIGKTSNEESRNIKSCILHSVVIFPLPTFIGLEVGWGGGRLWLLDKMLGLGQILILFGDFFVCTSI